MAYQNTRTQTIESPTKLVMSYNPDKHDDHVIFNDLIQPHLHDYCPASNLAFNERIQKLMKQGKTIYHFGFGQAPFPIVEEMVQGLKDNAGQNAYLPVQGIPELRREICDFHERYDKLQGLDPDQIIIAPGSKELIFLLMNIFNGDVLVISPTWTTYKPQSLLSHHKAYHVTTSMDNHWRITPHDIEKTINENKLSRNKILIFCNPDNPTGTNYHKEHLKALSEVCRKHNIIVLSDEIYARLHYDQSHDTLARYYPEGTIISTGFSKWASAGGWRMGYHIYPKELNVLKDAIKSAASHTYSCAPAPMQYGVAQGLKHKAAIHSYILHTSRVMAAIADYCHRELTSVGVKCQRSSAGYYIMPDFAVVNPALRRRGITTCARMCEVLFDEASVALMSAGPAFLRPLEELTTRLCYVNFDGSVALKESRRLGLDTKLNDEFLQSYCQPMYDGIQVLKNWVQLQQE